MPGWARGGAGPALWYRAGVRGRVRKNLRHAGLGSRGRRAGTLGLPGPCWSRRGCGPVQFELLPGYRAEPSNVTFSYIKQILSGTGLNPQKSKTWVPGWTRKSTGSDLKKQVCKGHRADRQAGPVWLLPICAWAWGGNGVGWGARVSHLFWFCSPASEIGAVRLELICFEGGVLTGVLPGCSFGTH